jgi:hypothetical protein
LIINPKIIIVSVIIKKKIIISTAEHYKTITYIGKSLTILIPTQKYLFAMKRASFLFLSGEEPAGEEELNPIKSLEK